MESFLNYKIKQFVIEPHDGEPGIDMRSCIASVQYYEDLFSPAIFISLVLVNTQGLLTSFPNKKNPRDPGIKGGERVRLEIEQLATKQSIKLDSIDGKENAYYIYKIYASTTEYSREVLVVELCSAEVFINETSRVVGIYKDPIGTTVDKILTDFFKGSKYDKKNIEQTSNKYVFYGNIKRPFTVLTWLCPKSIPYKSKSSAETGTSGFLFYQNKNGFNFKSIDSLLSGYKLGTTNMKEYTTYYYGTPEDYAADNSNFLIKNTPTFEKNVNIMENLRIGMYASNNHFFDINARKWYPHTYTLKESYKLMDHTSGSNVPPPVPLDLDKNPSRWMVRTLDNFNSDPSGDDAKKTLTPAINNSKDNTPLYQAASIARYNLTFSQKLNITVPLNLNLTVGDLVELKFPKITLDKTKTKDDQKSGFYLIKELAHSFEKNQGYTGLKVVRDSYGEKL